ncbi:MAG TPA: hypothetical protein VFT65_15105 [Candidatus Angelobacter sp.]|nr:hypothetical protein [Candidatus Angelobacter sp.]
MKVLAKLLLLLSMVCLGHAQSKVVVPAWKVDLNQKFGFQGFDRPVTFRWTLQENVVFLSPDELLVYQVNRSRTLVELSPRDASGGGGNFVLDARILSTHDGHEIKSLRLTTNADSSEVLATRQGRFIVRTGDILYLYSAGFERIASIGLPLNRRVKEEDWQIGVSPSGAEVILVHNQILKRAAISPTSAVQQAGADVQLLDEATLNVVKKFTVPWFIASWSAGEHKLVSSQPSPAAEHSSYGLLDFDGNWSPLLFAWYSPMQPCAYLARAVDEHLFVTYGCGDLYVFPQNGQKVFSLKSAAKEFVGSVKSSEGNLAVQAERHFTKMDNAVNVPIAMTRPLRIDVYDIKTGKDLISVPLHATRVHYSLNAGTLAVVEGTSLSLYQARP